MNDAKWKFRWKHGLGATVAAALALALVLAYIVLNGVVDRWARGLIVDQISKATGTRVELGRVHFEWRALGARFEGLTLHGREPAGTPPLFHADQLHVQIHVESFWGRKISLGSVEMSHFSAHVRVERDGSTNYPGPAAPARPGTPVAQRLFDLKIARLRLEDGEILWNDTRVPLAAEGGKFEFVMDYAAEDGRPVYLGNMSWQKFEMAASRYLPFASDLSAKFTLRSDSLSVAQLQWKIPHSVFDVQADVTGFSQPVWAFRYRGESDFEDVRTILRKPRSPTGLLEFTGEGRYAAQQLSTTGRYVASGMAMNTTWFHTAGMSSRGSYRADRRSLDIPDLEARVFDGNISGSLHMDIPGQRFRFESHGRGMDLSQLMAAENNPSLPIVPLHWSGRADIDATTTWVTDFQHLDSRGVSVWSFPENPPAGRIPASARLDYHYEMDRNQVEIAPSEINTPSSRVAMHGTLGATNSMLDVTFDTQDLSTWDDFINRLRGVDATPQRIAGRFHWQGRITGPLVGPTFTGRANGSEASYAALYWDELEGEMTYSPDGLIITRGRARRGRSSADLELTLALDNWSFTPDSDWTFDTSLISADPDDVQKMLGTAYPVHGVLSGQFHGKGTRANPDLSGSFDASNATVWTWRLDRARGEFSMRNGELRVANVELRMPVHAPGTPAGLITGNVLYHPGTTDVTFDITGAGIPLEDIERIQTDRFAVGGRVNLQVRGQGPLLAPEVHGTLRLVDFKVNSEVIGSFDGKLDSDGRRLSASIESALSAGRLAAKVDMNLSGDYPLTGEVTAEQIDFDPVIIYALHLTGLTGHSNVDGHMAIAGFAARPETISIEANLSRVTLDYDYVKLENDGPVRFTYRGQEIRVDQANLRGSDTDFRLTGTARFVGDRAINLRVDGAVSLQLLAGFVPPFEATGRAQVNGSITGFMPSPRIIGKVHLEGAALRYGDFPAGLSNVAGDFNFDTTRMVFDNVTAESGGGKLNINGAMAYGNGSFNYTINARTDQVRIRYPAGLSWLVGGTLRFSGTSQAAILSGRVVVDRLLMAEGFDLASFMLSAKEPVSVQSNASSFLRNLQFDIQADSSPDSRMEWAGANFQTDASLRLRGTWEHPILIGHIHLLAGEMTFRGNRFTISRGDINFANPFRLDPTLNVEATTTIRQYEVTLDFTGPASRLTLAYRSDPPLPSNDIIALLALGQTNESSAQRTMTGNSGLGASTLLSEAISSQLGGRVERLFGVSHFSVGPSVNGTTATQNSIASVTIEQQITPQLVVTYTTDVTSTQYQVIQVEYTINREFSVVALRDQNGVFDIDVVRKTRFK